MDTVGGNMARKTFLEANFQGASSSNSPRIVQRDDEEPFLYNITYCGRHTCRQTSSATNSSMNNQADLLIQHGVDDDDDDDDFDPESFARSLITFRIRTVEDNENVAAADPENLRQQIKLSVAADKKAKGRSRVDCDADNLQLQQLEEKDVVSSVATVLSDLYGSGEWMPMEKFHTELLERYGNVWHHSRVRRYLSSDNWTGPESKGKPWYGLLMLLRKYPENFVINTRSKGRVTLEFVSLVSAFVKRPLCRDA
ncbi:FHA domain-containing protein FHA2-like [Prosopis cineraria]|uniref:FHA domain-containing protein FHA2-like n=1 Tax=Prosopis cineraria TaxID=364024 RepID=UPI00240FBF80|nr:FHA domain-containing protein FHA2-like [Prosopis cineraria]